MGESKNMRTVVIAVVLLLGAFFFGVGRAAAADPGEWEVGHWSGDIHPDTIGCTAVYFNPEDDFSFVLKVYNRGLGIRDSSLAYIYFTDDGDDIDEDKGFSGFLSEKSSITFSMGNGSHTSQA